MQLARLLPLSLLVLAGAAAPPTYDVVVRNGMIYDGSGGTPFAADVAVSGDRIAAIGPHLPGHGRTEIDARGKAVAPGFINMLAHPEESLIADGRAWSDLAQGVTLEVMGEISMGPLTPELKALAALRGPPVELGPSYAASSANGVPSVDARQRQKGSLLHADRGPGSTPIRVRGQIICADDAVITERGFAAG